jgi:hypothetical protein
MSGMLSGKWRLPNLGFLGHFNLHSSRHFIGNPNQEIESFTILYHPLPSFTQVRNLHSFVSGLVACVKLWSIGLQQNCKTSFGF